MALAFSNTTTKDGIIQTIERNCGFTDGAITGNTLLFQHFTADVNLAQNEVWATIFDIGGTWQFDDTNHTDYPTITTNIILGQRDYPFVTDENGNLILEVEKVLVADSTGRFYEVSPTDVQTGSPSNYWDGGNTTGLPNSYDKLGNSIFLDPIPNYNRALGLKVYISREGSYFTTSDTAKKPGFAGIFHEYLALAPSYRYARNKGLANKNDLEKDMLTMKEAIKDYYKSRERDVRKQLTGRSNNSR